MLPSAIYHYSKRQGVAIYSRTGWKRFVITMLEGQDYIYSIRRLIRRKQVWSMPVVVVVKFIYLLSSS